MNIAVIGSGLAGLTAAYFLSADHHITLYEKAAAPGMDAHSIDVPIKGEVVRVDVPLRVFFTNYYPSLTRLYDKLGIAYHAVDCASSWHEIDGETYFAYRNGQIGKYSLPLPFAHPRQISKFSQISRDAFRLCFIAPRHIDEIGDIPFEEYLVRHGYSNVFIEQFIIPLFAAIGTCSYATVRCFPARYCIDYMGKMFAGFKPFQRVTDGTIKVVERLSAPIQQLYLNNGVMAITRQGDQMVVWDEQGRQALFDQVIMASPAWRAREMLDPQFAAEREALSYFPYERTSVVVHTDTGLAPRNPRAWTPINGIYSPEHDRLMATLWVNPVIQRLDLPPIFQTDDPIIDPDPAKVISSATFERAVASLETLEGLRRLDQLHAQTDRRLWFCGAYAAPGIPLLEGAASSALNIVERLKIKN